MAKSSISKSKEKKKLPAKIEKKTQPPVIQQTRPRSFYKYLYSFGDGRADGNGTMIELLGVKGANLAEMTRIGLPVPPGFTITTEICAYYSAHQQIYPHGLQAQLLSAIHKVEKSVGKKFGCSKNPLLVSVRSGTRESIPGMMVSILNLGLNDETVFGLISISQNERFAYDCYRRFIQTYGGLVMGVISRSKTEPDPFEAEIQQLLRELFPNKSDSQEKDLNARALRELVDRFKKLIHQRTNRDFPTDPYEQLQGAVGALFDAWNNAEAALYRQNHNRPHSWGTAVNIQTMAFGNTGQRSGSGIGFTRHPETGKRELSGEFLLDAQGEDLIAGLRAPEPLANLKIKMSKIYRQLQDVCITLEKHFQDMQDFEFTIENGRLYILQTRNARRTGFLDVKLAVEMVREKLITPQQAVKRVSPESIRQLLAPFFKNHDGPIGRILASGLPLSPGAASGRVCLSSQSLAQFSAQGDPVLLLVRGITPEDLPAIHLAKGYLTTQEGLNSYSSLVAHQLGKPCLGAVTQIQIHETSRTFTIQETLFQEGDFLSIDGTTGEIFSGHIPTLPSEIWQVLIDESLRPENSPLFGYYTQLMCWADKFRKLQVRATPHNLEETDQALKLGAEGLCLSEIDQAFFSSPDPENRSHQATPPREVFLRLFTELNGRSLTTTLPNLTSSKGLASELRGGRLSHLAPEITVLQTRALFEAGVAAHKKALLPKIEIIIPWTCFPKELERHRELIRQVAYQVQQETKTRLTYSVGLTLALPRSCIVANQLALTSEFFNFDTLALTEHSLGMNSSVDHNLLCSYQQSEILPQNPFLSLDSVGVGELVKLAIGKGLSTRPKLRSGVTGPHAGDLDSIKFFHRLGMHYITCSPSRIPEARLAAAQAALG